MSGTAVSAKDFAIGVLSVTAVILCTGLILVYTLMPEPAMGMGQTATQGRYVATTSQLDSSAELLFVLDTEAQMINVYGFNINNGSINLLQHLNVLSDPERKKKHR